MQMSLISKTLVLALLVGVATPTQAMCGRIEQMSIALNRSFAIASQKMADLARISGELKKEQDARPWLWLKRQDGKVVSVQVAVGPKVLIAVGAIALVAIYAY